MTIDTATFPSTESIRAQVANAFEKIGVDTARYAGSRPVISPVNGAEVGSTTKHDENDVRAAIDAAQSAFLNWREVPAPVRGALVKRWGELLVEHKQDLASIITVETGKISSEAAGEVQEMIDIVDLAVGQSRQLFGKTMPSERPGHRLAETWHPLGVVAVITAFNFPVAVFAWNTALALVAGDTVIWKPAEAGRLASIAVSRLLERAAEDVGAPEGLHHLVLTDRHGANPLIEDDRVRLVSATGSVRMGREIAPTIAARFGRALLELGGNNGAIVAPSADIDLALRGIVFSAAGTAGQRCTTLRRLIVHKSIAGDLVDRIARAYATLQIGAPTEDGILIGPLINKSSFEAQQQALQDAVAQGGTVVCGGERVLESEAPDAFYVQPAVVRMPAQTEVVYEETFAPILYVVEYETLEEAIAFNNEVPQGLSSAIFTQDQAEAERFLSASGSDCGIANVNIGTSGAEIGGAFGGEKETGGGRESGADSWRVYMRQATNTINYSGELPLAQGVKFI
ncbi:L-piperidine-6-carboxylate dehydrogenase [Gulosibacter molinativorax]|uniref:Aldehyde dehydrogenase family protein n=1 Tax=Gulosibacter molinativorax TaxID=256821 RepID=A0ABT7C7W8_9MICO|nr:aldehyde dehydrogenase family protein [Gulosibacter molinativorax]MDJ1371160.1 aldehyde dehydrogenase family protein [Gulosibacter molinativorax]QUY62976.1 Piperideine-6-carboxylate dehydrogenase [Gulosibacter molinativorax]